MINIDKLIRTKIFDLIKAAVYYDLKTSIENVFEVFESPYADVSNMSFTLKSTSRKSCTHIKLMEYDFN